MFDNFKATHGGEGPFQRLGDVFLGGLFYNNLHADAMQQQWTETFDAIKNDPNLTDDFKSDAARVRAGRYSVAQASQILGKLTAGAEDQRTIAGGVNTINTQLDKLAQQNPDDLNMQQIDVLRTRADLAKRFALSSDPKLAEQGHAELFKLAGDMQTFASTNESQRINADAAEATMRRELDNDQFGRFKDLQANQQKLGAIAEQQRADVLAFRAGQQSDPSAARDLSLLRGAMRIANPGAAIRPGETADAENTGGIPEEWLTAYNRILNGGARLSSDELAKLNNLVTNQVNGINEGISQRNSDALKSARAAGLPGKYLDALPVQQIGVQDIIAKAGAGQSVFDESAKTLMAAGAGVRRLVENPVAASVLTTAGLSGAGRALIGRGAAGLASLGIPGLLGAGAVASGIATQAGDEEALAPIPGESQDQYQQRVAEYLSRRSGEQIDPASIHRPTDEF